MQSLPDEFVNMVKNDIERIDKALENGSDEKIWTLFREIDARYQACVRDWYKGLWNSDNSGKVLYIGTLVGHPKYIRENLTLLKAKLETYQYQMNAVALPQIPNTQVNVTTNVGINLTFEQVKSEVKDMTSLTDEQTEEILAKINELEKIVESEESKKSKWTKAKSILKWLADKSCDVGIALLPLFLKI